MSDGYVPYLYNEDGTLLDDYSDLVNFADVMGDVWIARGADGDRVVIVQQAWTDVHMGIVGYLVSELTYHSDGQYTQEQRIESYYTEGDHYESFD